MTNITQELNKAKNGFGYYEQDLNEKISTITRITNEKELLKSDIIQLNEEIT